MAFEEMHWLNGYSVSICAHQPGSPNTRLRFYPNDYRIQDMELLATYESNTETLRQQSLEETRFVFKALELSEVLCELSQKWPPSSLYAVEAF